MRCLLFLLATLCVAVYATPTCQPPCQTLDLIAEFVTVEYDWSESPVTREQAIATGMFVPENNIITGINEYKGTVFVCVPRWKTGVPATLAKLATVGNETLLQPFPNWEWQQTLHYVQSVFIDQASGTMWIIDTGRQYFFEPTKVVNGPAKLYSFDLETGKVGVNHTFLDSTLPFNNSFLNDIKVDPITGRAFMTDTNMAGHGALIFFDTKTGFERRFEDPTSTYNEPGVVVEINEVKYPSMNSPVDGIALSTDYSTVYYSSVQGQLLHAISAIMLSDPNATQADLVANRQVVFNKHTTSDGLLFVPFTSHPAVIFGACNNNSVAFLPLNSMNDLRTPFSDAVTLSHSSFDLQWQDTFALVKHDSYFSVYFTTNRLQHYAVGDLNFAGGYGANFRMYHMTLAVNGSSATNAASNCPKHSDTGLVAIIVVLAVLIVVLMIATMKLIRDVKFIKKTFGVPEGKSILN